MYRDNALFKKFELGSWKKKMHYFVSYKFFEIYNLVLCIVFGVWLLYVYIDIYEEYADYLIDAYSLQVCLLLIFLKNEYRKR